jgi:hypothetical protein
MGGKGEGGGKGEKGPKPCMHIWIIKKKEKKEIVLISLYKDILALTYTLNINYFIWCSVEITEISPDMIDIVKNNVNLPNIHDIIIKFQ